MDIGHKVSEVAMYTDFNALARLKAEATNQTNESGSSETNKKVASQIEAMFFQMVLKSMREAQSLGDSAESDQTRFYQDMFDKQITLEIAQNSSTSGNGLAAMIEKQLSGPVPSNANGDIVNTVPPTEKIELIRNQIAHSLLMSDEFDGGKE